MKDKKWLKKEVFELYPKYGAMYVSPDYETVAKTETISKVLELIDQLDEFELTQDQVDKYLHERKLVAMDATMVHQTGMQNKVVAEKPVIPQKIADFIEKSKGKSHSLADAINSTEVIKWFSEKHRDEWLYSNERENLFARAWLDGYEVEKEKLYTVNLPHYYELIKLLHTQTYRIKRYSEGGFGDYTNTFTEAEIKAIDKRYWAFAEEVTE